MDFFSEDWGYIGSRHSLGETISAITRIDIGFFFRAPLHTASVAKRLSWASCRQTSRSEDMAYCLLGIFDVNMPLLYGEGSKAFIRLQEAILKSCFDYSLFAWGSVEETQDDEDGGSATDSREALVPEEKETPAPQENVMIAETGDISPLKGLLAASPRDFASAGDVVLHEPFMEALRLTAQRNTAFFDNSLRIALPIVKIGNWGEYWWTRPRIKQYRSAYVVILGCKPNARCNDSLGIPLVSWGNKFVGRRDNIVVLKHADYQPLLRRNLIYLMKDDIIVKPEIRPWLLPGDIIFRRLGGRGMRELELTYPSLNSIYRQGDGLLRLSSEPTMSRVFSSNWVTPDTLVGIAVVAGKVPDQQTSFNSRRLYIGLAEIGSDYKTKGYVDLRKGPLFGEMTFKLPIDQGVWYHRLGAVVVKITVKIQRMWLTSYPQSGSIDVIDLVVEGLQSSEVDASKHMALLAVGDETRQTEHAEAIELGAGGSE